MTGHPGCHTPAAPSVEQPYYDGKLDHIESRPRSGGFPAPARQATFAIDLRARQITACRSPMIHVVSKRTDSVVSVRESYSSNPVPSGQPHLAARIRYKCALRLHVCCGLVNARIICRAAICHAAICRAAICRAAICRAAICRAAIRRAARGTASTSRPRCSTHIRAPGGPAARCEFWRSPTGFGLRSYFGGRASLVRASRTQAATLLFRRESLPEFPIRGSVTGVHRLKKMSPSRTTDRLAEQSSGRNRAPAASSF